MRGPRSRREVVDLILECETREEVAEAKAEGLVWIEAHPDDFGIIEAMESVYMVDEAYRIIGFRRG
jgi:hypothetical protein